MSVNQVQIEKLCRNREHFYYAMLQNSYYLPERGMKSSFCTVNLFREVVNGICWLPKQPRFKNCLNPPPVSELVEMISDGILTIPAEGQEERKRRYVQFLNHLRKRTPDQEYLIQIVGILNSKHPIFQKGYKNKIQKVKEEQKFDNINVEFWGNVQELPASELRKRGSVTFLNRKDKLQVSVENMKKKRQQLDQLIELKKEALEKFEEVDEDPKFQVTAEDFELLRRMKIANAQLPVPQQQQQQEFQFPQHAQQNSFMSQASPQVNQSQSSQHGFGQNRRDRTAERDFVNAINFNLQNGIQSLDINSSNDKPLDQYLKPDVEMKNDGSGLAKRGRSTTKQKGVNSVSPSPLSKLKGTSRTRARDAAKQQVSPFRI